MTTVPVGAGRPDQDHISLYGRNHAHQKFAMNPRPRAPNAPKRTGPWLWSSCNPPPGRAFCETDSKGIATNAEGPSYEPPDSCALALAQESMIIRNRAFESGRRIVFFAVEEHLGITHKCVIKQ